MTIYILLAWEDGSWTIEGHEISLDLGVDLLFNKEAFESWGNDLRKSKKYEGVLHVFLIGETKPDHEF